jgi:hypothetical protein
MRWLLSLALSLPLAAQAISVPCEAPVPTLRLLESLPPLVFLRPYLTRMRIRSVIAWPFLRKLANA